MAISAREELRRVADTATADECEIYLAGPMLLAACESLETMLAERTGRYDTGLHPVLALLRKTIAEARGPAENIAP